MHAGGQGDLLQRCQGRGEGDWRHGHHRRLLGLLHQQSESLACGIFKKIREGYNLSWKFIDEDWALPSVQDLISSCPPKDPALHQPSAGAHELFAQECQSALALQLQCQMHVQGRGRHTGVLSLLCSLGSIEIFEVLRHRFCCISLFPDGRPALCWPAGGATAGQWTHCGKTCMFSAHIAMSDC